MAVLGYLPKLTWVAFLWVRLEVEGEGIKLPDLCIKLVRIMLETSHLAGKYTLICSFRKYTL